MFNLFKSNEQKFKDKLEEYFYAVLKRSVMRDSDMGSRTVVSFQRGQDQFPSFQLECSSLIETVNKISDWLRSNQNFCVKMSLSGDSEDSEPRWFDPRDGTPPVPFSIFPMEKFSCIYLGNASYFEHLIVGFYVEMKQP
ncbi:hypothetical protein ACMYSO_02705 [Klebsiella sp. B345]|uniref:hypothetical protein n=1 Tax=Klebsiella sp. B345 TaxID=2755398 RepID=UPI003DAA46F7